MSVSVLVADLQSCAHPDLHVRGGLPQAYPMSGLTRGCVMSQVFPALCIYVPPSLIPSGRPGNEACVVCDAFDLIVDSVLFHAVLGVQHQVSSP